MSYYKDTVQALKYPSADAVTQNVHKTDTTASNALCHRIAHENGQCQ